MNNLRAVLVAIGFAAFVVAVSATIHPAVEASLPAAALVAVLGNDYVLVAVIASVVLVALVGVLVGRLLSGVVETIPPAVEETTPERPGSETETVLQSLPPVRLTAHHHRLRRRLRETAIAGVADADRCDDSTARHRVETRSWTDDALAAGFVDTESFDPPSVSRRVGDRLLGRNWFRHRFRRTVAALEALEESR